MTTAARAARASNRLRQPADQKIIRVRIFPITAKVTFPGCGAAAETTPGAMKRCGILRYTAAFIKFPGNLFTRYHAIRLADFIVALYIDLYESRARFSIVDF